jgi:uncharacterized protein YkwD
MRRRTITTFLCAAVVLLGAPALAASMTVSTYESQIVSSTNSNRASHGLVTLKEQSCAKSYAVARATWMAANRTLKHSSMTTILTKCHFTAVAENIAYGYSSGTATVNAWMASSGHRKNILTAKYRYIGSGARMDSRGVWWAAEILAKK